MNEVTGYTERHIFSRTTSWISPTIRCQTCSWLLGCIFYLSFWKPGSSVIKKCCYKSRTLQHVVCSIYWTWQLLLGIFRVRQHVTLTRQEGSSQYGSKTFVWLFCDEMAGKLRGGDSDWEQNKRHALFPLIQKREHTLAASHPRHSFEACSTQDSRYTFSGS